MTHRRRRYKVLFLVCATVVCCQARPGFAADYFVATTGNDRNSGRIETPLHTILRAVSLATRPGDRVVIRRGTYYPTGTINLSRPGTATQPIVVTSYPGEEVVVDGRDTPELSNLIAIGTHDVRIEGLTVRNAKRSGIIVWGPGSRVYDVSIVNNVVEGCFESGIYAGFNSLTDPVRDIVMDGNTVRGASLKNRTRPRSNGWAFGLGSGLAKNVTARNNNVSKCYGEGIGFYLSDECRAEGNTVHDCFSVNLYLDNTTNTRVAGNYVYSTGDERFFRFNQPASGIQIANENYGGPTNLSSHNLVVNNVVVGSSFAIYVASYQQGGGLRHSTIAHNTCVGATNRVLHIDSDPGHADSLIANNIFCQTSDGPRQVTDVEPPLIGIRFQSNFWSGGAVHASVRHGDDVAGTPRFVGGDGQDVESYRLSADSVGRNAVDQLKEVGEDLAGKRRRGRTSSGAWN